MIENAKVAVVGVGNNTSALVQGIAFYRATGSLVGVHRPELAGLGVGDVDIVAAFAMSDGKVGADLHDAIFLPPNNFPRIVAQLPRSGVTVQRGLVDATPRALTPMEAAQRAIRAAGRESARLGRSGQRGKGSGNHFGDDSVGAADGGS